MDILADRIFAHHSRRDAGFDRRLVEQGCPKTKNTLRHVAYGMYLPDSGFGDADGV